MATFTSLDAELVTPERSLQLAAELEPRLDLHEDEENPLEDVDDYARLVD